jgi:hypothetical protein
MSQLQRLFFINLSKHVQNALTAREVLRRIIQEDRGGVADSADLVVRLLVFSYLWLVRIVQVLFRSTLAKVIQEGGVAG